MTSFDPAERYVRQSQFGPIGEDGQLRLSQSHVTIIGMGALGSVAAELMARAGVGTLRLIDRDVIEPSNLQRQSLYDESDAAAAMAKVEAATGHLARINSSVMTEAHVVDVTAANVRPLVRGTNLIIDASDNFSLRLLLNDVSLELTIPWVHGGAVGSTGQVKLFDGRAPCFRCLVREVPNPADVATCDTAGVIAPATHLIASLQCSEALKWLTGNRDAVNSDVLSVDLWANQWRRIGISSSLQSTCPACHDGRRDFLEATGPTLQAATSLCGRDAVQISGDGRTIDFDRMAARWRAIGQVQRTRFFIRLNLTDRQSLTLFRDGRVVVTGVRDTSHARGLSDQYVGS
ncbi:MAG: ThiF family adenylyltransferase [Planctomycetota bacterium]